ncbi:16S rRNA (guanine(527)-N(7))-methyltransferase RsmG [Qingshengfaniella alkalisoli]|uniref:Ribosomal RNA small subunit methyltransferase G n=1 Tax=Qingshengfaniella alkalisoli TaxID=2599296 RepID=A0A5B8I8C1_9RHOB|nr:16S rRNA (guanine(527)-N(7))-methyltransferase RsmG [Qingshengfaniella alkalisoli]QDY69989.1 16S rRNA (guanine(527)-N(7))-methyltransferase RsmG [Qingshengfaniella alkalisoli]
MKDAQSVLGGVSRETVRRLEIYADLLVKWNKSINLVSPKTINDLWSRHLLDSAQIFDLANVLSGKWVDLGSGGGFPGLVVAIIAAEKAPSIAVTCIESDIRKATFLRTVSRETSVSVSVIADRIEMVPPQSADVVSARALAPLPKLIPYAYRHLAVGGIGIFPKGERHKEEINRLKQDWSFKLDVFPSRTESEAAILRFEDLSNGKSV